MGERRLKWGPDLWADLPMLFYVTQSDDDGVTE
jgi:hypothetical protein